MKNILFGIALVLFGFICIYVALAAQLRVIDIAGAVIAIIGLFFAIGGMLEVIKSKYKLSSHAYNIINRFINIPSD